MTSYHASDVPPRTATLGLVNSYPGLILPTIASAFGTFLLRQAFLTLPRELDEA